MTRPTVVCLCGHAPTEHEYEAMARYAAISGRPITAFTVVARPEVETWYDFLDPETGIYGQCRLAANGAWQQAPRGQQPVILRFDPRRTRP